MDINKIIKTKRKINPISDILKKNTYDMGIPKYDGSGKGVGANYGRGGCKPPKYTGRRKVTVKQRTKTKPVYKPYKRQKVKTQGIQNPFKVPVMSFTAKYPKMNYRFKQEQPLPIDIEKTYLQ